MNGEKKVTFNYIAELKYLKQKGREIRRISMQRNKGHGTKILEENPSARNNKKPLLSAILNDIEEKYNEEIRNKISSAIHAMKSNEKKITDKLESRMCNLKDTVEMQLSIYSSIADDIDNDTILDVDHNDKTLKYADSEIGNEMFQCTDDDVNDLEQLLSCCPGVIGSFSFDEDSFPNSESELSVLQFERDEKILCFSSVTSLDYSNMSQLKNNIAEI